MTADTNATRPAARQGSAATPSTAPALAGPPPDWVPHYTRWRHGGWYVVNVMYASGACGCVSNHYEDGRWRIVCDDRRDALHGPGDYTFPTRDAAARAEYVLAAAEGKAPCTPDGTPPPRSVQGEDSAGQPA